MGLGAVEMRFFSDNAAAAHPRVIEAIAESNRLDTAYDGDEWSGRLDSAFSIVFETDVRALWVTTGTAANCLALAALCPPHGAILCHKDAHIENDEAGAPGFYTNGAKLMLLDGPGAKIAPDTVVAAIDRVRKDVHQVQPRALSITNATEYGLAYRASEVAALGDLARSQGLGFHMDGARWLANARSANAAAQAIAAAAGERLIHPVEANEIFLKVSPDEAASLRSQGFDFYDWGPGEIRLVTSWDQQGEPVERLAAAIAAL